MKSLNTHSRLPIGSALLSATLAGGVLAYSAVASAAEDKAEANTQTTTEKSQNIQSNPQQSGQENVTRSDSNSRRNPQMGQVDQNEDAELVWTEIYAIYDEELDDAAWTEAYVFETYDENADNSLNADEYVLFVSGLGDAPGDQSARAESDSSSQQNATASSGQNQQATSESNQQAATGENSQQQEQQQAATAQQDAEAVTVVSLVTIAETALAPSDLEGREVVNYNNDEIGDVEQIITSPDGTISGLVVGVGGFWGMGENDVFVPANELRAYGGKLIWETFLDEDQLEELPQYQDETYSAAD